MWSITNKQLTAIAQTKRLEFENIAYKKLYSKSVELCMVEHELRDIISIQTNLIEKYKLTELNCSLKLIELAMKYSVLNKAELPEDLIMIFNADIPQSAKVDSIESVLILSV